MKKVFYHSISIILALLLTKITSPFLVLDISHFAGAQNVLGPDYILLKNQWLLAGHDMAQQVKIAGKTYQLDVQNNTSVRGYNFKNGVLYKIEKPIIFQKGFPFMRLQHSHHLFGNKKRIALTKGGKITSFEQWVKYAKKTGHYYVVTSNTSSLANLGTVPRSVYLIQYHLDDLFYDQDHNNSYTIRESINWLVKNNKLKADGGALITRRPGTNLFYLGGFVTPKETELGHIIGFTTNDIKRINQTVEPW